MLQQVFSQVRPAIGIKMLSVCDAVHCG